MFWSQFFICKDTLLECSDVFNIITSARVDNVNFNNVDRTCKVLINGVVTINVTRHYICSAVSLFKTVLIKSQVFCAHTVAAKS